MRQSGIRETDIYPQVFVSGEIYNFGLVSGEIYNFSRRDAVNLVWRIRYNFDWSRQLSKVMGPYMTTTESANGISAAGHYHEVSAAIKKGDAAAAEIEKYLDQIGSRVGNVWHLDWEKVL